MFRDSTIEFLYTLRSNILYDNTMTPPFRHHDSLRLFVEIARYKSFSDAAEELNMTKGAVSYQIKTLEADLGTSLFTRTARGVALTQAGQQLQTVAQAHFQQIETELAGLRGRTDQALTVGMSSYFASRWLSPRLMSFMQDHPDIQLRIQPMTRLFDLERQGVDIAIRWGDGQWDDAEITPFLSLPAWPVGNAATLSLVQRTGLGRAIRAFTLLHDHDDSNAWSDWLNVAGLPQQNRRDTLIIPDPNVRVQGVIDGQGLALMDDLIGRELSEGRLYRLSEHELSSYGYFLARPYWHNASSGAVDAFIDWLLRAQAEWEPDDRLGWA